MTVGELLASATQQLQSVSDSPRLDAEVLLAHCLNKTRTWLVTWPDKTLEQNQQDAFRQRLERRLKGEPVAHITGEREFWSLPLKVNRHTLIPRPDTELMIEVLLAAYPQDRDIRMLDLGTGSGAIALAMASEKPEWAITATDRSADALQIARENAEQLSIDNVRLLQGSWFDAIEQDATAFDIIASNPPYIAEADPHLEQGDVRFEPRSALTSGDDGLDDIRLISQGAMHYLKSGGRLIVEHGFDQEAGVCDVFSRAGYQSITQYRDLAGNPRLTSGIKP